MYWQKELDFGESFNSRVTGDTCLAHYHEEVEVALCFSGSYTLFIDGVEYAMNAGDVSIISSMLAHEIVCPHLPELKPQIVYVIAGRGLLGDDFSPLEGSEFTTPVLRGKDPAADGLRRLLTDIYDELTSRRMCEKWMIQARTLEIFALLMRQFPAGSDSDRRIRRRQLSGEYMSGVFRLIRHEYMHEITVDDAAGAACLSKTYFCRAFKEMTGKSFHEYLVNYRMVTATKLLVKNELMINEVAAAVGMPVVKTFNRCFKAYTGMTPREYRKKYAAFSDDPGK